MFRIRRFPLLCLATLLLTACASEPALEAEEAQTAMAEGDSEMADADLLYALGYAISGQLGAFDLSVDELKKVQEGIADGALGKDSRVDMNTQGPKLQALAQSRQARVLEKQKAEAGPFLEEQAAMEGAERFESGLIMTTLEEGDGASPSADSQVRVHYHGTLPNGKVFDSSVDRGEAVTFPLNQVIPCWTEGVQKMKVGGKARLVCPSGIAYGDQGRPPQIPGGSTLIFEVDLLEIVGS